MVYIIILLFAIAALVGILILKNWLTNANTSRTVIYSHGAAAALALVLLIVLIVQQPVDNLRTSLILFIVAALGGFFMFFRDLKGKLSPMWLAFVHGLLAVTGFIFLLLLVV